MKARDYKNKYNKAHSAYMRYKDTNGTNCVEAEYLEEAIRTLQTMFPGFSIITVPDHVLNYLGADFIVTNDKEMYTVDLKVCQNNTGTYVTSDMWKHDATGNLYPALDDKITDYLLFRNKTGYYLVNPDKLPLVPQEYCFYLKRDLYRTTLKATINISNIIEASIVWRKTKHEL